MAQIIDYARAPLPLSLYWCYTLLDGICFAMLFLAFPFDAVQGYINKGFKVIFRLLIGLG